MNTPTPETDAAYKNHAWDMHDHIPLDFARKLERERDELQRAYDTAIRQMNQAIAKAEWLRTDAIAKLERERDEARDRADTMFANHADILDQARRERDYAREQLAAERELADRLALALKMTRWDSPVTCKKALAAWKEARRES